MQAENLPEPAVSYPNGHAGGRHLWLRLHAGGAGMLVVFACMSWASGSPQFSVWAFLVLLVAAWVILAFTFLQFPAGATRSVIACLWFWAVTCRLAGLFAEPLFEDDWHRYLWDAHIFATEGNPYAAAPSAYFSDRAVPPRFQQTLDNIGYPDVPTLYGPMCEYIFLAGYAMAPGELWPIKLLLLAADLLAVFCLLRLTTPRNTLLFAWSPLVIQETAFNAHPEMLGVSAAVAALYFLNRGQSAATAGTMALCVAARVHGLILAPLLLARVRPKHWALFAFCLALMYLPFWVQGSSADWQGLRTFLQDWEFNSTAYAVLAAGFGTQLAKSLSLAFFSLFYGWYFWRWQRKEPSSLRAPRGDWLYGLFFLLSAVVNPWYLLWLAPFVALKPTVTGVTACAVVSWSYLHGLNWEQSGLPPFHHPWWVRPAEIIAVALAWAIDLSRRSPGNRETG